MNKMADDWRREAAIFFIYDHNVLKKEEDDLIDAILYFSPEDVSADDQCALCGQLMGMAEFLTATLGKSPPKIFKFEHEKFAIKRVGGYSLGLQCKRNDPDSVVFKQLDYLYGTFVTFHGSLNSLRLRCKDNNNNFTQELRNIWRNILNISGVSLQLSVVKTFHHLPYIQLPKTGSHLYLQASHLLQSSQRRPYVLGGAILYKNEVVCTQLPPMLTRQLTYLQEQMPYIEKKMDFDLPVGCKICTLFLTDEELLHIFSLDPHARRHCKITDFSSRRESETFGPNATAAQRKVSTRRLTCPDISSGLTLYDSDHVSKFSDQSNPSSFEKDGKGLFKKSANFISVDKHTWARRKSKMSLSHVPIVECRSGESPTDPQLTDGANESYFGKSYRSSLLDEPYSIEILKAVVNVTDNDSDDDLSLCDTLRYDDANSCKSESTDVYPDKEIRNSLTLSNDLDNGKNETNKNSGTSSNIVAPTQKENINESFLLNNKMIQTKTSELLNSGCTNEKSKEQSENNTSNTDCISTELENCESKLGSKFQVTAEIHKPHSISPEGCVTNVSVHGDKSIEDIQIECDNVTETDGCDNTVSSKFFKANFGKGAKENSEPEFDAGLGTCDENDTGGKTDACEKENSTKLDLHIEPHSISPEGCVTNVSVHGDKSIEDIQIECDNVTETDGCDNTVSSKFFKANFGKGAKENSEPEFDAGLGTCDENDTGGKTDACEKENSTKLDLHIEPLMSDNSENELFENYQKQEEYTESTTGDKIKIIHSEKVKVDIVEDCIANENENKVQIGENLMNENGSLVDTDKYSVIPKAKNDDFIEEDFDSEKENLNPDNLTSNSRYITKSESSYKKGESFSFTSPDLEDNEKPCLNCLDLMSGDPQSVQKRCSHCLSKKNSPISSRCDDCKETIDFLVRGEQEKAADNTSDPNDNEISQSVISTDTLTLSSDVSTDSTISRFWTLEMDGLNDVTLYIQCHSDISLLLLMENPEQYQEDLLHSLWKGSLHYLADLDFYIKECLEQKENVLGENFNFVQFNKFSRDLKDNIEELQMKNPFNQVVAALHAEFDNHPSLNDLTLRGQAVSCYGHRNEVNETFFQLDGTARLSSGLPVSKDPKYILDSVARIKLAKDRHISLM